MPQRFLRPGITNSKFWNSVGFECQSLYIRIITLVDDFGRCDGRAAVVWGSCFAVWNEQNPRRQIGIDDIRSMLQQLAASRLISTYSADDKDVIQVEQWQERIRDGSVSKWPGPRPAATCSNLLLSPSSPPSSPPPSGDKVPVGTSARKVAKAFVKPSAEELGLYASKIGLPGEQVQAFLDHYEANGWKVGRNPMRDWQATMRTWQRNWRNGTYANNKPNRRQSADRNAGTFNEGRSGDYANAAEKG